MRFADAGGTHQQHAFFSSARVIANKSLSQQLGLFQRVGLLRRCADVRAVAFKIAMLVALGDMRALDNALGTLLHAAIAGNRNLAGGSLGPRQKLPACSSA